MSIQKPMSKKEKKIWSGIAAIGILQVITIGSVAAIFLTSGSDGQLEELEERVAQVTEATDRNIVGIAVNGKRSQQNTFNQKSEGPSAVEDVTRLAIGNADSISELAEMLSRVHKSRTRRGERIERLARQVDYIADTLASK